MKKRFAAFIIVLFLVSSAIVYINRAVIFQRGNPIPYLTSAMKITKNNSYVKVTENVIISEKDDSAKLIEDFEQQMGVTYVEQMGSGYLFSNGKNNYVIESEIYWGKFTVWTLPNIEGHHFEAAE